MYPPMVFVVKSIADNTCYISGDNIDHSNFIDYACLLSSSGALPGGLDLGIALYIINATKNSFQLSTDGINPLDITSKGTGTHYITFL